MPDTNAAPLTHICTPDIQPLTYTHLLFQFLPGTLPLELRLLHRHVGPIQLLLEVLLLYK